jgi:hypothetical protein
MAKNFHIGDNVAVKYQSSIDEDYWILFCDKSLHMVGQAFKNDWGQECVPRDWVIFGIWYGRLRPGSMSYILLEVSSLGY